MVSSAFKGLMKYNRTGQAVCSRIVWILFFSVGHFINSLSQSPLPANLQLTEVAPTDILASRTIVLHDCNFTDKELKDIQKSFQQTGIDAVAYFETDVVFSGKDVTKSFAEYFVSRQAKYLLFLEKSGGMFILTAVLFNQQRSLFDPAQPVWREKKPLLNELLRQVFQDSWLNQKKQNYLINDFPETDIVVDPFKGTRQEFYAIDLKVDLLAVPKFGNEQQDKELEQFFQTHYPLKYKMTEAGTDEQELRRQGFSYILCYVRTRGKAAREILGYDMTKGESAYASITFPAGQLQLKTLPSETVVYKFYFRHIGNGNVFFGTKWDADINWQDALKNHVLGFKTELKIY